ncbi:MAG: hypothetical protein FGM32_08310 [Candidatus Kapabacteria bacterium]|nr:hypothetical protein [Candidatus Kapabacteria bacterium]
MDTESLLRGLHHGFGAIPTDEPWRTIVTASHYLRDRDVNSAVNALCLPVPIIDERALFASALLNLRGYNLLGDTASATVHADILLSHSLLRQPLAAAVAGVTLGAYYRTLYRYENALSYLVQSEQYFQEIGWTLSVARCSVEIASILLNQGDYQGAIERYTSAAPIIRDQGSDVTLRALMFNLAVAHHHAGDYQIAYDEFRLMIDSGSFGERGVDRINVLLALAITCEELGRHSESADLYDASLLYATEQGFHGHRLRIRQIMAASALRTGDFGRASAILDERATADVEQMSLRNYIELLHTRARYHVCLEQHDIALELHDQAMERARAATLWDVCLAMLNEVLDWPLTTQRKLDVLEEIRQLQRDRMQRLAKGYAFIAELRHNYEIDRLRRERERKQEIALAISQAQDRLLHEVGRELHDSVGQDMIVLTLLSKRLSHADVRSSDDQQSIVSTIDHVASRASNTTRRIAHLLAGGDISGAGLRHALMNLRDEACRAMPSLNIEVIVSGSAERMRPSVARTLFRIAQTSLQNTLRHAEATSCTINLIIHPEQYFLSIEDNGVGFDKDQTGNGMGLQEIYARTELHSGTVSIESAPGKGAYIEVTIPSGGCGSTDV